MVLRRCLMEFGTGVDLHGGDSTKAARRAVFDALRHSSVSFPNAFGYAPELMVVEVKIAVPDHHLVRPEEVLLELPYGQKTIKVVEGGLKVESGRQNGDATIMANAAIIVSLDIIE